MSRASFGAALLFFLAASNVQALGPYSDGDAVVIRGTLRLVGNEPFSYLVVTTPERVNVRLPYRLRESLRALIGSQVSVTGRIAVVTIASADHKHSLIEYRLTDVTEVRALTPRE